MFYKEYMPAPLLQDYVVRYWIVETDATDTYPMEHVLTPNGLDGLVLQYRMDVPQVFVKLNERKTLPANYVLVQPVTHWKLHLFGSSGIAGIFFKPGVLQQLLKYSMTVLADQPVELEALVGNLFTELGYQLEGVTHTERIELINKILTRQLDSSRIHLINYAKITAGKIMQYRGNISVQQLADELHISRQFLTREFYEKVGISPKAYTQVIRFNTMHKYIISHSHTRWTDVTYMFGYSDQSHFIKEFKKFMGVLPNQYALTATQMADFYAG